MSMFFSHASISKTKPLASGYSAVRPYPANMKAEDEALFRGSRQAVVAGSSLLEIEGVTALGTGMLFQGAKLLKEGFVPDRYPGLAKRVSIAGERALSSFKVSQLDCGVWVTDKWSSNYYHWMTDALPRLQAVLNHVERPRLILPERLAKMPFVQGSLEAFGLDAPLVVKKNTALYVKTLMYTNYVSNINEHHKEIISQLRDRYLNFYRCGAKPSKRIYISRSGSPKRNITNEAEVLNLLKKHDFETIHAENLSFSDQVRVASQAAVMFGPHGAGLTNAIFMHSGAKLIELHPADSQINDCFFNLANSLDLVYYYSIGRRNDKKRPSHEDNIVAILPDLEEILAGLERR